MKNSFLFKLGNFFRHSLEYSSLFPWPVLMPPSPHILHRYLRQQTLGGQQRPVNAMGKGTRMAKPTMPGVETAAKPNLEWQLLRTATGLCVSRLNRAAAARRGSAAMTRSDAANSSAASLQYASNAASPFSSFFLASWFKLPKHHLQFFRGE